MNRRIAIPVLSYPEKINVYTKSENILQYVEYAFTASVYGLVLSFEEEIKEKQLKEILSPVISVAKDCNISLLIETSGPYVNTEKVLNLINLFGTAVLKVCWNIRETYFFGSVIAFLLVCICF